MKRLTINKNLKTNVLPALIMETKRDVAKIIADLKFLKSGNFVVKFWRKSEIQLLIFAYNERVADRHGSNSYHLTAQNPVL